MGQEERREELFRMIRSLGASVMGVGAAWRFRGAPRGHSPEDIIPGARSVITSSHLDGKVCLGEKCSRCVRECPGECITLLPSAGSDTFWDTPAARIEVARCRQTRKIHYCMGKCIRVCPAGKQGISPWP